MTCGDCYYLGLKRGADKGGDIHRCRVTYLYIRSYHCAGRCPHFINKHDLCYDYPIKANNTIAIIYE